LSQSTAVNSLPTQQTSAAEKTKKKKTKSKKRSEKIENDGSGMTGDGVPSTEFDSAAYQLNEESSGSGKRSKKLRHEGQVVRAEDVDGYRGSLPVDDLIKFIDCSRWHSRSQSNAGTLAEVEKLQSVKKETTRDSTAVENDSGFGDAEVPDRTDASRSDGALSPSVSSISETAENVVDLLSESLNPVPSQSATDTREGNLNDIVCEITTDAPRDWSVEHDLSLAAAMAFMSDEEIAKPEPEFTVVRQKKRRTKGRKIESASSDKPGCLHNNSSASSERSNSPPSVAAINEINKSHLGRQMSDTQAGTTAFRRFNSEPKWRTRHPHFNSLPDTSVVRARTHVCGSTPGRTTVGGKNFPQQREMGKTMDRKCNFSDGISCGSQLPDVVLNAERPRQADTDRPCMTSSVKVMMQDAHCQTVDEDDTLAQSPDHPEPSRTHVPFDLLTLQMFMYHGQ